MIFVSAGVQGPHSSVERLQKVELDYEVVQRTASFYA